MGMNIIIHLFWAVSEVEDKKQLEKFGRVCDEQGQVLRETRTEACWALSPNFGLRYGRFEGGGQGNNSEPQAR